MNSAGITSQSELARRSGVPQPTINRILNGVGRQGPATETLKKLAVACEMPFQWLADGTGAERGVSTEGVVLGMTEPDLEHLFVFPKPSHADKAAGPVRIRTVRLRSSAKDTEFAVQADVRSGDGVYLGKEWLQTRGYHDQALIALAMDGDSMEPGLYAGDILVVNLSDRQLHDGEVFVLAYEGTVLIRRLLRDAGRWWLCSDSAAQRRFPRKRYANSECSIIGRVVFKLSEKI
ncbi:helix-turn-helix domain-containing protein|nr:helix-turn-helix domain-containing protein [Noviherbaspirillum sp. L7-7A]